MKFSRKMYPKIILKVIKNQGFTLSLEGIFLKKLQRVQIDPSLPAALRVRLLQKQQ